ncbi:TapB family protein [Aquimarina pacifica]|uniref:TapB family protein n=1 Tax=Aquimarina pacifica TaxID=1296415 RepID=UPI000472EB9F|nr:hypothetical protein [Aquimarina pacifica]
MKIKKRIQSIIVFGLLFLSGSICTAQDCNAAPFMNEGTILTYTDYNKKGKKKGSTKHETINVSSTNNGISAQIKATLFDERGKETFNTNYRAHCKDGLFSLDMLRFFDMGKLSEQSKNNLNLKIDGDVLEFPYSMKPGDILNDGTITVKVNNEEDTFTLVTLTFDVFNRKIIGEESITTPAGTFNCQKVTFDFASKFGILNIKGSGVEWYYKNVVVVRSESYTKKGKLIGYHELTDL